VGGGEGGGKGGAGRRGAASLVEEIMRIVGKHLQFSD